MVRFSLDRCYVRIFIYVLLVTVFVSVCCFVVFVLRRQQGKYGDLLIDEESGLARLMETFAEDGSDNDDGHEVRDCVLFCLSNGFMRYVSVRGCCEKRGSRVCVCLNISSVSVLREWLCLRVCVLRVSERFVVAVRMYGTVCLLCVDCVVHLSISVRVFLCVHICRQTKVCQGRKI